MCWQIPEWASGATSDRHHRARQILESPIATTYPQGSGCSVCVAREKFVPCPRTTSGVPTAPHEVSAQPCASSLRHRLVMWGPWGKAMCPSADGEFALRMLLKFTYGALGIRSRSFRPNHGEEVW